MSTPLTSPISRRRFLTLTLITGAAVSCGPLASGATAPPLDASAAAPPGNLPPGMRFALENDSIAYGPHPRGCDVTSIRGSVRLADGSPLAGMVIRLWSDDPDQTADLITKADGSYGADVAKDTPHMVFHLLLLDSSKQNRLSDVIIAEATGSCDLNLLTVNFVPAS